MLRTKNSDRHYFLLEKIAPVTIFLCLIFINPFLSRADDSEKTKAVNQQLNMFESSLRESPNVHPERPSAGAMLKDFLSPELSLAPPGPKSVSNVKTRVHNLDAGSEIFYSRYQEPGVGVKIYGPMYGYYADYAYRPADPNFFNNFLTNVYMMQARYASSRDLDYKGSGIIKGKHDDAMEFRGLIGKDYFIGTDSRVTPYFGFGYRYLFDHGNGHLSSTNHYAYDRKSHYYYLPLGGDVIIDMPKNWEMDFNVEYDIFLQGKQKSFLSNGFRFNGFHNPDLANWQDHGFGIRGSIKFLKRGSAMDFYVEPYIRYWNIDQSKSQTAVVDGSLGTFVEPKNNTTEVGSKFGIQF